MSINTLATTGSMEVTLEVSKKQEMTKQMNNKEGTIKITKEETTEYQIFKIEILSSDGIISPSCLEEIQLPYCSGNKAVVIDGRAPIWLYSFLFGQIVEMIEVTCIPFIAISDPRLEGAIVAWINTDIESDEPCYGDIVKWKD